MRAPLLTAFALLAVPVAAQDRPFCANRPGLGTPVCTLSPGTGQLETGLAHGTRDESLAALSTAWQPGDDWQLDLGTAFGLNRDTADTRLYFGVVKRF